ncbi:asparagine-rich antigen, putative [Plasmodium knowlesi strain H]|uniref:histone acetyltransferase n=3 Tax=Plasmodium knowlesi TaxID=5850 RepID=A0A5K1UA45_PLAKH|nr:asparagine-rich antigen, putative [Plasmodium knowlesi strain H]OTN64239.1 putative Asparagine-rich antigen [Plasmodium knowlesi]CAA9990912.1 asparagine-rich antigen, putative [Plasmodium knowlesi strain H]SBO20865.1 asparagine-rich antigen, putative [Plasmodium knowlesi strain H]SBO21295.1 asparagine-rich antigen, putative [Plasmodium knowlesi strain H]VVS80386.1 asparagine-rich antigen, putative [Plasmodium knowlesi strain H]|eukprot:XP_002262197.1 asparagine-rich antigen, putative [Plasmodium knowlesi strain H]
MDSYNANEEKNLNFITHKNSYDENMNSRSRKSSFIEFQYDRVVNNVLGLFKKQNKQRFLSTSSALRNDMHEQILCSRLFLDLCEDREILLHKILKKINILNLIYFRFLKESDIDDVFDLHNELFPVKYQSDFYFSICNFADDKVIDDEVTRIVEKISRSLRSNAGAKRHSGNANQSSGALPEEKNEEAVKVRGVSPSSDDDHKVKRKQVGEKVDTDKNSNCKDEDIDNISNKKIVNSEDYNSSNRSVDTNNDEKRRINKKWKEEEIFSIGAFLPFSFIDYINSDHITKLLKSKSIEKVSEKEILLDYIKFIDDANRLRSGAGDENSAHISQSVDNAQSVDTTHSDDPFQSDGHSHVQYARGSASESRTNNRRRSSSNLDTKSSNSTNPSAKCLPTICFSQSTQNDSPWRKTEQKIYSHNKHKDSKHVASKNAKNVTPHNLATHENGQNICRYNGTHLEEYIKKNEILKEEDCRVEHKKDNHSNDKVDDKNTDRSNILKKEEYIKKYPPSADETEKDTNCNEAHNRNNSNIWVSSLQKDKGVESGEKGKKHGNSQLNSYLDNLQNNMYDDNNTNIQNIYKQLKEKNIEYEERRNPFFGTENVISRLRDKICLSKETLNLYNRNKKRVKSNYLIGCVSNLINYQDARNEKDFINIYNHFKKKSNNSKKGKNYLKYVYDSSLNFLENYIPLDKNGNFSGREKTASIFPSNNLKKTDQSEQPKGNTLHTNGRNDKMKTESSYMLNENDEEVPKCSSHMLDQEKKKLIHLHNVLNDLSVLRTQYVNKDTKFEKKLYEEIYMNENIKTISKKYIKKKINSIYILTVGISEYFRGLNLASYLIEYTVFYFYFIIYRIFLYKSKFYCYIDNDMFYSISSSHLGDQQQNDFFDEGLLTDNSSDDFYSIVSDEKSFSDREYKMKGINGKEDMFLGETRNCLDEERKQSDGVLSGPTRIFHEQLEEQKNENIWANLNDSLRKENFVNDKMDDENNEMVSNLKNKSTPFGNYPIQFNACQTDEHGNTRRESNEMGERDPFNFKTYKINNLNSHAHHGNKRKNKWSTEKSKNYSISNGVLRECYKQIILNDYLHHLYVIIQNKNAEMLPEKETQKGEAQKTDPFPAFLKFPLFKNPLYSSGLNNKMLDFFLNNFCAFNLKDRPFFHLKNANARKPCLDYNDDDVSLPLYIYLHVIDYNKAAINLYNKLNFDYICTYDNFYDINKMTFSSFLYSYFF